jgi:hypothetical protein
MKKTRLLTILVVILSLFIFTATPAVAAAPPLTYTPNVTGMELFAGVDIGHVNWGATFTAKAQVPYKGVTYNCVLFASIDYTPDEPVSNGSNRIVGGSFTLDAMQKGKNIGTIKGRIKNDGSANIQWINGTDYGHVVIPKLTIVSATGKFSGASGGSFDGYDNHVDGPVILGITVPTIVGLLIIN